MRLKDFVEMLGKVWQQAGKDAKVFFQDRETGKLYEMGSYKISKDQSKIYLTEKES